MWHIPIFPESCSSAADIILTNAIKIHMESPYIILKNKRSMVMMYTLRNDF